MATQPSAPFYDNLLDLESCPFDGSSDGAHAEEVELECGPGFPQRFYLCSIFADMKAEQESSSRRENTHHFPQRPIQIRQGKVYDRVKCRDSRPSLVSNRESSHVSLIEFDSRIQSPSAFYHSPRQIHTANLNSASMEIAGDVSGPATKVAGNARVAHALGKAVEQSTIQGLVS